MSGPVLVTGAAGFAGSHLIEHLAGSTPLVAWARSSPPAALASLATWKTVDLLDRDVVRREISALKPSRIFHCAGVPHVGSSWQDSATPLRSNVMTTHYLLEAVRRSGVSSRILITGSAQVYAASNRPLREDDPVLPTNPYGVSKLAQEQVGLQAARDGLEVILVRPFNHTGPRQAAAFAAPAMARQLALIERRAAPPVIKVGNLDPIRDLTDVRDTVRAYALLMDRGTPGSLYNIASGVGRPIRELLNALVSRSAAQVEISPDPERFRPNDTPFIVGDATRLRTATGWEPAIGFDRMLDDLLAYWRQQVAAQPG